MYIITRRCQVATQYGGPIHDLYNLYERPARHEYRKQMKHQNKLGTKNKNEFNHNPKPKKYLRQKCMAVEK